MVKLNCVRSRPDRAELFGARGAYTGPDRQRALRAGGPLTIFLDEIAELPWSCSQAARVLETGNWSASAAPRATVDVA